MANKVRDAKEQPSGNPTKEKLKLTPFGSAAELKSAREKLQYIEWANMTRADIRAELLINGEDCGNLRKMFEEGVACSTKEQDELFRVYTKGYKTLLDISPSFSESKDSREVAFKALVESTTNAQITAFHRAVGLVDPSPLTGEEVDKLRKLFDRLEKEHRAK